jgi:AmmeMemoRadiSam system protein B
MQMRPSPTQGALRVRRAAFAGSFYPADRHLVALKVGRLLMEADRRALPPDRLETPGSALLGLLVPHAGLDYSGIVAASGWRLLRQASPDVTVVLLGTNHGAGWLRGVGVWESGVWSTPMGDVSVDAELARAVLELGEPFVEDGPAHLDEHSIEVQLPLLQAVSGRARIVPLAVSTGTGREARMVGARLGTLLGALRASRPVLLAISSDMAHYPAASDCEKVTEVLVPPILDVDPTALARAEHALVAGGTPGLACGMCGIEPAVLGLAALREAGATRAVRLAAATSADAGGSIRRAVGYLAAAFMG